MLPPLALFGAAALSLSLVLASGLVVPDALAGRAFEPTTARSVAPIRLQPSLS